MNPVALIEKKRDGGVHSASELQFICHAASTGTGMAPEQLSAWLMAVVWRGMSFDETAILTQAMVDSGERLDLAGVPKPWFDKHSTGGVGDKTTLALLPMLAAAGLSVVKMSGRGLGITGGTIDKLESIPGFRTALSLDEMKAQASRIGIALTGQTPDLAPADKALYALRDVTGTVRSIPLIASSVMSKKIAGGADVVGIDLKCGRGAFMRELEEARDLGRTMIEIGKRCGLDVHVEITEMDQPLGRAVGNLIEVQEAVRLLAGEDLDSRFGKLCVNLCGSALEQTGLCSKGQGISQALAVLESGRAMVKCEEWWSAQGAALNPIRILEEPLAGVRRTVTASRAGWVETVDAAAIGQVVVDLGGGRKERHSLIDHGVGVRVFKEVGMQTKAGEALAEIYAHDDSSADEAAAKLLNAFMLTDQRVEPRSVILEVMR